MPYFGDFTVNSHLTFMFNTRTAAGVPITLAGSPVVKVYWGGGADTDTTAGVSLAVDFDSLTGLHLVTIDMSQSDGFYTPGFDFHVVLTAGTIDGVSAAGMVLGSFSIEKRTSSGAVISDIVSNATMGEGYGPSTLAGTVARQSKTIEFTSGRACSDLVTASYFTSNITPTVAIISGDLTDWRLHFQKVDTRTDTESGLGTYDLIDGWIFDPDFSGNVGDYAVLYIWNEFIGTPPATDFPETTLTVSVASSRFGPQSFTFTMPGGTGGGESQCQFVRVDGSVVPYGSGTVPSTHKPAAAIENSLLGQRVWDKDARTETIKRVDGTTVKVFDLIVDAAGDVITKTPRA